MDKTLAHTPVLPMETMQFLGPLVNVSAGAVFVDATLGAGGHTRLLRAGAWHFGRYRGVFHAIG